MFDLRQIDQGPHCGAQGDILSLLWCVGGLKRGNLGSNRPKNVNKNQQPPVIEPKIEAPTSDSEPVALEALSKQGLGSLMASTDGQDTWRLLFWALLMEAVNIFLQFWVNLTANS